MMTRHFSFYVILGLALIAILAPESAFAFKISFESPDQDKSIFYLGQIFGPVGTALPHGTGNALLSNLFSIFNIAVLTLGSIVVSYTIILSTINTAQEGEVMGRKWSSLWIPLRSAVGITFLIPTASGYSLLQILMMSIIVYGIGAANQLWGVVVNAFSSTTGTGLTGVIAVDGVEPAARTALKANLCQKVLNESPVCGLASAGKPVTFYPHPSDNTKWWYGVKGDPNLSQVCGEVNASTTPPAVSDGPSWYATNYLAIENMNNTLKGAATEIFYFQPPSGDVLYKGASSLRSGLISAPLKPADTKSINQAALENGWLFAGSYYVVMISNNPSYSAPSVSYPSSQQNNLGIACKGALTTTFAYFDDYLNKSQLNTPPNPGGLVLPSVAPSSGGMSQIMDTITKPLRTAFEKFMVQMTTADPRGPIPSLARVGSGILNLAESMWIGLMIAALVILLPACVASGTLPTCAAFGSVFVVVISMFTVIIGLLWGVGGLLGIYLPLVPYLVFTFTALGWMLLVIETIVAAPIVALGLVSPAGEHLGKAAPAVLLVVNVFLRPSLMIIGFVVGAKLVDAIIGMLNYGFFATVNASVSGIGIFGTIALLTLYGGTVLALIHECFSLIHILPDKIIRWLGGQAEQSQVKQHLGEAKKSMEKGHETGAGIMKSSAGAIGQKAQEMKDKAEKGEKGEKGDKGTGGTGGSGGSGGGGGTGLTPPGGAGGPPILPF